jgi:hypothetical protein
VLFSYTTVMSERVQVLLEPEEKARLQRQAKVDGTSLSAWIREAAMARLAAGSVRETFRRPQQLRAFFRECAVREHGREPDWSEHEQVISSSRARGASGT